MELLLANPRGFCAGVDRAIEIVERALALHGAPIYVRHEVVHNTFVVDSLKAKGAVFIEDLNDVPPGSILIFSAHGVPQSVRREAEARGLTVFDATCPLVPRCTSKCRACVEQGKEIMMIGHKGHPEVEGTMGQSNGGMYLVETPADVESLKVRDEQKLDLCDADHPVGGRCQCHHRRAQDALSFNHRAKKGRYLLRHAKPPGCGKDVGQTMRPGHRGWLARTVQIPTACEKWQRTSTSRPIWSITPASSIRNGFKASNE